MNKIVFYLCTLMITVILSCGVKPKDNIIITLKNTLDIPRDFETIEILKLDLSLTEDENFEALAVRDIESQALIVSQFVDQDGDGKADLLLFQPTIGENSQKKYELVTLTEDAIRPEVTEYCYSRFVPERTDDYAWENNKVAFRTYGPVAQKMVEESVPGGTLSSGIDAWLKRVEYPIINKWYAKNDKDPGAYHKDSGDGLDNFHVGPSRGVGGTAVKIDSTYYISNNFVAWETITTGPIRTSFVLDYGEWDANGQIITEKKHISLDYGSNLSRFEITTTGTDVLSAGVTLHDNKGEVTETVDKGWVSYWEPHEGSEIGTAIIAKEGTMLGSDNYVTSQKDRSNLYTQLKVENDKVVYYAGFAWKESNQYPTKKDWEIYLNEFSRKINNPIEVVLTNN